MKNILRKTISVLVLGAVAFNFAGCFAGAELPEQTYKGKGISFSEYTYNGNKNEYKLFFNNASLDYADAADILCIKEMAKFGKVKGFKYFTVNTIWGRGLESSLKNKELVPITSLKEFMILKGHNQIESKNHNPYVNIHNSYIKYSNELNNNEFFWDVESVLKEEVEIYNKENKVENEKRWEKTNEAIKTAFEGTDIKYKIIYREETK